MVGNDRRRRNSSSYIRDKKYQRVERERAKELGSNNPAVFTGDTSNMNELVPHCEWFAGLTGEEERPGVGRGRLP